jgi:predicted glycosyltransferase
MGTSPLAVGTSKTSQKRALLYAFDAGTGVGHLRRLARIAKKLQGRFACLIVTGHRAAAHWFVPEECEYVHLPSWDSLIEAKARYWGRLPFINVEKGEAIRLRAQIMNGIIKGFRPHLIFVDHLPLGAEEELATILKTTACRKYFITRGILNETENLCQLIPGGKAYDYVRSHYHKVLVATDSKVFDFSQQYNIAPEIREKTFHTGYISESISAEEIARTRKDRGLAAGDVWVVASAGGGQLGEKLIEGCLKLAKTHRNIAFDIILGPRSNLEWADKHRSVIASDNVQLQKEVAHMPFLHAGANLVISSGGYNSVLEALFAGLGRRGLGTARLPQNRKQVCCSCCSWGKRAWRRPPLPRISSSRMSRSRH